MHRFFKKRRTISLLYLDYFERKIEVHCIGKGDKDRLSPLHPS